MKRYLLILSLCLISTISFSQSKSDVENAVEKLRLSLVNPTVENLKEISSTSLTYGHSSGVIENQDEFIEALISGASDFRSIELKDQTIIFPNKNTALVRHKLHAQVWDGTKTNPINLGVLLVWVKEKGKWKLTARQAFRL
ncbi:nuclear transport factor 2 family protein [Aquiflexum sp.]|uniref:nuclear transport factor 2 family protein n=1 Tax=Aquiflexum sp. TaxID=1872584 RepID=UPI00359370A0